MFKRVVVTVSAAACAGLIIGFIPKLAPPVAAEPSRSIHSPGASISDNERPTIVVAARVPEIRKAACTQSWPYYEQSCLHDARRADGRARIVHVVTFNHSIEDPTSQLRR
jgi:hypothetical protein